MQGEVKALHRGARLHRRVRRKDRGYFDSVYVRTPGGALFEATSKPEGFLIDEAADELGTHMCIPPHWEDRRGEIAQLEPIDTEEVVVS